MKLPVVNLNKGTNIALQVGLLACQTLVPVFVPLSHEQHTAIIAFASGLQAYFGYSAHMTNPDGTPYVENNTQGK